MVCTYFFNPSFEGAMRLVLQTIYAVKFFNFLAYYIILQSIICTYLRGYDGASTVSKNLDKQMDKVWIKLR